MDCERSHIISKLKKEIILKEGDKKRQANPNNKIVLGPLNSAFPNNVFPIGATHEFIAPAPEHQAASFGFISTIISMLNPESVSIWVGVANIFPPALKAFGLLPERVVFVDTKNEKEKLWVIEEALKCESLTAVVGELKDLNFSNSRRFQLAVENSNVTGFIIRNDPRLISINACVSRWKISPIPGISFNDLPGLNFPTWDVKLLKIRNGYPGKWQVEWSEGTIKELNSYSIKVSSIEKNKEAI